MVIKLAFCGLEQGKSVDGPVVHLNPLFGEYSSGGAVSQYESLMSTPPHCPRGLIWGKLKCVGGGGGGKNPGKVA